MPQYTVKLQCDSFGYSVFNARTPHTQRATHERSVYVFVGENEQTQKLLHMNRVGSFIQSQMDAFNVSRPYQWFVWIDNKSFSCIHLVRGPLNKIIEFSWVVERKTFTNDMTFQTENAVKYEIRIANTIFKIRIFRRRFIRTEMDTENCTWQSTNHRGFHHIRFRCLSKSIRYCAATRKRSEASSWIGWNELRGGRAGSTGKPIFESANDMKDIRETFCICVCLCLMHKTQFHFINYPFVSVDNVKIPISKLWMK